MSRWPPSITSVYAKDDALRIEWELEGWFSEAEEPDEVYVEVPGDISKDLGSDARDFEIPAKLVEAFRKAGAQVLSGNVIFKWRGPPDDVKSSGFSYPIGGTSAPAKTEDRRLRIPRLTVASREPKTLRNGNRVTIAWAAHDFTLGELFWGPEGRPMAFKRRLVPRKYPGGVDYSGRFTTTGSLAPGVLYHFRARVQNGQKGWKEESAIVVRAADNHHSVRGFLEASGVGLDGPPGSVRLSHYLAAGKGLRDVLGV